MVREVYLDNSATTIVHPQVVEVMIDAMTKNYGNPSSLHSMGIGAEKKVAQGRRQMAQILGCQPKELFFTASGSESNNLALKGVAQFYRNRGNHLITSKTEHPSVLTVCEELAKDGFEITYLDVNNLGEISLEQLSESITDKTILVSIMMVNNELGTVQPIEKIVQVVKEKTGKNNILIHADGVQAIGMFSVNLQRLGVDLFSFSGHKFHGPKGIGGLYVKAGTQLKAQIVGGGQENGLRSGTENVPGIAGMAAALRIVSSEIMLKTARLRQFQQMLWQGLKENIADCKLNSNLEKGAPHIVSISFPGVKGEVLLHFLESEGIFVSTGSACSSRSRNISHVLASIGLTDREADGTIRFSFSVDTTEANIQAAINKTIVGVNELKKVMGRQ